MLETPVGALSLPGILAASMASAPISQVFVGVVELLAGVLLMIRPTASAGAVLAVGTTANVVVLNYAYHYTMYLLAIAMFVMALILTLPALPRLANAMVLNRAVPPAPQPLLFVKPRVNAAARAIGLTLLVVVLGYQFSSMRTQGFYTPPRPALYGAYEVLSFVRNRDTIPVTAGDSARWHGLTVDPVYLPNTSMAATGTVAFVRDTSIVSISVDTVGRTVTLRSQRNPKQQARFAYSIPAANLLLLSGIDNLDHAIAVAPSPAGGSPTSSSDGQRHPMPEQVDTIYVTLRRIDLHALRLIRRRAWFQ
jgi:hypothetical protein